jgi:phosphoserine phosphatase RsbU/P
MPPSLAAPTNGILSPSVLFAILVIALLIVAYILLRRYQSRKLLLARITELEALSAAGRSLAAAQMQVSALCELIAEQAGTIIPCNTFQVGLFEGSLYHVQYWVIDGRRQRPVTIDLTDYPGMVGWIRQTRRPLLIRDLLREEESLPAKPRYLSDKKPRSVIFIPLISSDSGSAPDQRTADGRVIGILAAQSSEPNRFSEEDLRRLMILANQAAAAIANARLFEQERSRAAHLELVSEIARQVNAIQDLDELFQQVALLTRQTFGFSPVNIFGIDPDSGEAVIQASSIPNLPAGSVRLGPGEGLVGATLASRETTLVNQTRDDSRFIAQLELPESVTEMPDTHAELVVPLIVDDELLGLLDVHSSQAGVFSPQEQMALETLAAQVAIAIHKTRQFAAQREQAWLTTAQLQVAETISASDDMEELLDSLTRLIPLLTGVEECAILLWEPEIERYIGAAIYGAASETAADFANWEIAIGQWTALDAVHVGLTALSSQQPPPWLKGHGTSQQRTLYPLVAKESILGVMVVSDPADCETRNTAVPHSSESRRQELMHNVSRQVAQAIELNQLRVAQQEEAWVNTALLQVAEAVNSLIDLHEILDTMMRLVPLLVGVKSCFTLVWDAENQCFHAGASYGLSEMEQGLLSSFEIDESDLPFSESPEEFLLSRENSHYQLRLPPWLQRIMAARSAYALPLNARGRLVGLMVVGPSLNGRPLSGRRLNILTGIAQQAAIAVVNDHLYQESAERSRMEQELNVARSIQASLIPNGNPDIPGCQIDSYWQAAREVSGDFYDFLALPNGQWGIAVADVADKGVPAALFMALSRTILRTVAINRSFPAATLERANQIIFNDTQSDLFVTVFYAVWDPETRTLYHANAGHNPPLLIQRNGQVRLLRSQGIALGVLEDIKLQQKENKLEAGDTVIFYTDGVTEAMNEDLDEFGLERLRLTAVKHRRRETAGIVAAITQAILDHAGDTPQFDDITLVVMKCL